MTAPYVYTYPFAVNGTLTPPVPTVDPATGAMSYELGYTVNYQEDLLTNPSALPINRGQMNRLFFDATNNIAQYQGQGTPNWITSAEYTPGGVPTSYPYPIYARVLYSGVLYENQVPANTATPGTDSTWLVISGTTIYTQGFQIFTTNGTYTPTPGMVYCTAYVSGGGGGGGSSALATAGTAAGAGGGSGLTAIATFSAATIGASKAVTIGAGGAGGVAPGGTGGTGGTSSLGVLLTASGGVGGAGDNDSTNFYFSIGGAGGTTSTGAEINIYGNAGGFGISPGSLASANSISGGGAGGYYGGSSQGVQNGTGSGSGVFASGGAGSSSNNGQAGRNGGAGAAGVVAIYEFIVL